MTLVGALAALEQGRSRALDVQVDAGRRPDFRRDKDCAAPNGAIGAGDVRRGASPVQAGKRRDPSRRPKPAPERAGADSVRKQSTSVLLKDSSDFKNRLQGKDAHINPRGFELMEPEKLPAGARKLVPDLVTLVLLIGCTVYVLLQLR